jgi:hypothetical protein
MTIQDTHLSRDDIELIKIEVTNKYGNNYGEKTAQVIAALPYIKYDIDYISPFGATFEGKDDPYYFQAMDKIDAFFKYGDALYGGGKKRKTRKRKTRKRKTRKRKTRKRRTRRM